MKQGSLVAVYGSLKEGFGNHRVLGDSELVGSQWLSGWDMYSMGSFPAIVPGEGYISVEIYQVGSDSIAGNLDMLEGYPSFYNRVEVETELGLAWIYYQDTPPTDMKITSGDWP